MPRPRIALVITAYHARSHADVLGTRLISGYPWTDGEHTESRVEVVSMYLEQVGIGTGESHRPDIGLDIAAAAGIPVFPTPAEAIGVGEPGVNVDGVVIIGEHGDFELNEYGQKLYPRRRLFDACLSTMIGAGRFVPIFNDKHLAWNFIDARAMYDNAQRLGVPFGAGSTVPITWRVPQGTQWPLGTSMTEVAAAGYGGNEAYGYHALEGMLAFAERRAGGETGVVEVQGWYGEDAAREVADHPSAVIDAAIAAHGLDADGVAAARTSVEMLLRITWADGLTGTLVMSTALHSFSVAAHGPTGDVAAELHLEDSPFSHFIHLTRAAEHLVLTGTPLHPLERTLLAGGILDHGMRNASGAAEPASPELADIRYQAVEQTADTAILMPYEQVA